MKPNDNDIFDVPSMDFNILGDNADIFGQNINKADQKPDKDEAELKEGLGKNCSLCIDQCILAKGFIRKSQHVYRKAFSELNLLKLFDGEKYRDGYSYHIISGGDIDSLSFLLSIMNHQPLDYLLVSTWCMAVDDVKCLREFCEKKKVKRIDMYLGEIFKGSYSKEHQMLLEFIPDTGGRICIFRNHSKIMAGSGPAFDFVIESSANVNTNPRTENTTINIGSDIFEFYKGFFDGIKSYERDFDHVQPWIKSEDQRSVNK